MEGLALTIPTEQPRQARPYFRAPLARRRPAARLARLGSGWTTARWKACGARRPCSRAESVGQAVRRGRSTQVYRRAGTPAQAVRAPVHDHGGAGASVSVPWMQVAVEGFIGSRSTASGSVMTRSRSWTPSMWSVPRTTGWTGAGNVFSRPTPETGAVPGISSISGQWQLPRTEQDQR